MADAPFDAKDTLQTSTGAVTYYRLDRVAEAVGADFDRLPFSIKVLMENALRQADLPGPVGEDDVRNLATYDPARPAEVEIPFTPARVLLQDFTGVPAVVDLAALRSAMARNGGDPEAINPRVPVDLVIDHSVQVDSFALPQAFQINADIEFQRNQERYEFLRWGSKAFDNFSVVPPERGICHQVNLEYIAKGVWTSPGDDGLPVAYPDTLVGTDSHTTMINGLGVLGWGVGGIEAEAAMLGQPIYMLMPQVVGFRLAGELREGVTATDLTLTVTQMLRAHGVVGKFVEFYGPGLSTMSLPDRATIANMAPEYGATMGFFPIDDETLAYLRRTARDEATVELVETYCRAQGLFRTEDTPEPEFQATLSLDLADVRPSMSGPKRPQDRIVLDDVQREFRESLTRPASPQGFGLKEEALSNTGAYKDKEGNELALKHGDVAIAAITSCTNTSNPSVMLAAGLLAKKAVERGMTVKPYVKTSLAPGSRVVTAYLEKAGLQEPLDKLGYNLVGYGCTTCIGNSGPLPQPVADAVVDGDLIVAGVLSGNRNFEGRIHALVKANYLASPPLVVAYALAGTVDIDLQNDVIGQDPRRRRRVPPGPVAEPAGDPGRHRAGRDAPAVRGAVRGNRGVEPALEPDRYVGGRRLRLAGRLDVHPGAPVLRRRDARGPDHPADRGRQDLGQGGRLGHDRPYLARRRDPQERAGRPVPPGPRRRAQGLQLVRVPPRQRPRDDARDVRQHPAPQPDGPGHRRVLDDQGRRADVHLRRRPGLRRRRHAVGGVRGRRLRHGLVARLAAKGTILLGIKAVVAQSFERIHRSNLVGMGVLPLLFKAGESLETYGLDGTETFDIPVSDHVGPGDTLAITASAADGSETTFDVTVALNTPVEVEYYRHGGILNYVLRDFLNNELQPA